MQFCASGVMWSNHMTDPSFFPFMRAFMWTDSRYGGIVIWHDRSQLWRSQSGTSFNSFHFSDVNKTIIYEKEWSHKMRHRMCKRTHTHEQLDIPAARTRIWIKKTEWKDEWKRELFSNTEHKQQLKSDMNQRSWTPPYRVNEVLISELCHLH